MIYSYLGFGIHILNAALPLMIYSCLGYDITTLSLYTYFLRVFFYKLFQNPMDPKTLLELKNKLKKDREEAYEKNEKYKKQKEEEKKEKRQLSRNSKKNLFPKSKIALESNKNRLLITEEKFSQQNSSINEYDNNNKQQKIRNMVLKKDSKKIESTDKNRSKNSEKQNTKTTEANILKNTKETQ